MDNSGNNYWDARFKREVVKILPGEYYVSNGKEMIVTVLGSCISACVQDSVTKIGGMNHFMLPMDNVDRKKRSTVTIMDDTKAARYGNVAMERLINDIVKMGGNRKTMKAKIFGGGKIIQSQSDIGLQNIKFVREYLTFEGIEILAQDVGDNYPRKVYFLPETNDVFVNRVEHVKNTAIIHHESKYIKSLEKSDTECQVFYLGA